jgi:hypothetical protein
MLHFFDPEIAGACNDFNEVTELLPPGICLPALDERPTSTDKPFEGAGVGVRVGATRLVC